MPPILILPALLLLLTAACRPGDPNGGDSARKRPTSAPVEKRNIEFSISVAGEISPAEQVSVRPEVNGRISELPVDIGDRVNAGALLFSLDDRDLQIELETRKTEIESAQLEIEKARQELNLADLEVEVKLRQTALNRSQLEMRKADEDLARNQKLFAEKLIARELMQQVRSEHALASNTVAQAERGMELASERLKKALDRATTNFQLATNAVLRARRNLELTEDRLSKTRIVAPFDCTVLTRPVSAVGQAVSGSGGFNSGTEVLTIANLNAMIIDAHVNQADIPRLRPGMEVDVSVEAVIGLTVKGRVERIAPKATIRNGIKGFGARILLTGTDERIQPGMTAKISIPVASAEDAVAVPLAAVFTEPDGRHVFVLRDGAYEQRPVKIGVSDYRFAEVVSGLNPGETVSLEMPPEGARVIETGTAAD